jgi:predicted ATPase
VRFTKFQFSNFRGIESATLNLAHSAASSIHVLVGLNESGKTTVLEAIDHFRSPPDLRRKDPNSRVRTASDYQAMIPISKRARFDGVISVRATVAISGEELPTIRDAISTELGLREVSLSALTFDIDHTITFVDSKSAQTKNTWFLGVSGKQPRRPVKNLEGEPWVKAVKVIERFLPKVMYFPSYLLEFPDQIPLEHVIDKKPPQPLQGNFYYAVLEDLIKAIDPRLSIETHLLQRLRSGKAADKVNAQALVQQAEDHLNRTILGAWRAISSGAMVGKQFRLFVHIDSDGICKAEIKLSDGAALFSLNERSAGFRWFFSFLMLVKYRAHRNDQVLFLFDEPAASLHPRAQEQLLNSFLELSSKHQFIYTTHSHYLVNPLWLESTYIVKNEAQDPAGRDAFDIDTSKTSISITPYRKFVGNHPDQQFYYKPIMDALQYSPSKLDPKAANVLVEGKTDFYCLEYFRRFFPSECASLVFFPGSGAGSLDGLISLMIGWGGNFVVLLDTDAAGDKEARRYADKFESLVDGRICALGPLITSASGAMRVEQLFAKEDRDLIRATFFPDKKTLTKKLLHKAMQELLATGRRLDFRDGTLRNFRTVLNGLDQKYKDTLLADQEQELKAA